jgi:hypothetical protein
MDVLPVMNMRCARLLLIHTSFVELRNKIFRYKIWILLYESELLTDSSDTGFGKEKRGKATLIFEKIIKIHLPKLIFGG